MVSHWHEGERRPSAIFQVAGVTDGKAILLPSYDQQTPADVWNRTPALRRQGPMVLQFRSRAPPTDRTAPDRDPGPEQVIGHGPKGTSRQEC